MDTFTRALPQHVSTRHATRYRVCSRAGGTSSPWSAPRGSHMGRWTGSSAVRAGDGVASSLTLFSGGLCGLCTYAANRWRQRTWRRADTAH